MHPNFLANHVQKIKWDFQDFPFEYNVFYNHQNQWFYLKPSACSFEKNSCFFTIHSHRHTRLTK